MAAFILRFVNNIKLPPEKRPTSISLAPEEVAAAKRKLFRIAQRRTTDDVIQLISKGKQVPKTHPLGKLQLTTDDEGTLMIECRIQNENSKPKLLTYLDVKSKLVQLFIRSSHVKFGHPGTSAMMAILSTNFYIKGLRNHLKNLSRSCVICQRAYQHTFTPKMGMLPTSRTEPAPTFSVTGIDFAGPLIIKSDKLRKPTRLKVYVAVFICLTTKAVHLDICKGLSTTEFLATFRRLANRRGTPKTICSDNRTNFVGAKHEMKEIVEFLKSKEVEDAISRVSTDDEIRWINIPPRAPHFGGLWEAAVRKMKILLRKNDAGLIMTYDELYTLLTEVEAIINSTPLTEIKEDDITEARYLTPGHFLIGRPLKAPADRPTGRSKMSNLRRWNLTQALAQDFWDQWCPTFSLSTTGRSGARRPDQSKKVT